jgi:hypothetical protein
MYSNTEKQEKAFTNIVNALDKIARDLEKLPPVFVREETFACQFDLYDTNTKEELFKNTIGCLRTLKMSMSIARMTRTNYASLSLLQPFPTNITRKNRYTATIHINCLPQENGRWVATATVMGLDRDTLGYGDTKESAVAQAIEAIVPLFEAQTIAKVS